MKRICSLLFVTVMVETYDHINTPYYKVLLTNGYEDGLVGVHLKNKLQQDRAMKEFVAGRLAAGEMGCGIELENMTPREKKKRDDMYKAHGFDEYISEYLVSLNRSLPDRRDDYCKNEGAPKYAVSELPKTSVIIIFHNEAWSTLIRTIYSVLNRSPEELIEEIILVDDGSTLQHLGQRLQEAVDNMEKVKLLRMDKRSGLMRTRMAGVHAAKAEVLTFLDSHIEATDGWLEPLLERIKKNPKAAACPVIEEVNDKTFQYRFVHRDLEGIFFWNLDFSWRPITRADWSPYDTPVMAGGLFSIRKDWFAELGYYDDGMEVWGGEQLELSFKIWMCGGVIEIVPCSRVGHIFRSFSPYKWRTDLKIPEYNYKRVADVWMDEYKFLYFDRIGRTSATVDENIGYYGEVDERKRLRESMQCNNFAWYLRNHVPHLGARFIIGAGEIRNPHHMFCMDQNDHETHVGYPVLVFDCTGQKGNQYWYYTSDGKIMRDNLCFGKKRQGSTNENHIELVECENADVWSYDPRDANLRHVESDTCIKVTRQPLKLWLVPCNRFDTEQKWYFTNYAEEGIPPYEEVDVDDSDTSEQEDYKHHDEF
eukprot:TRINITY_DN17664_c0_g1_i2.p1 TRINITY_DN17664_c0_g1~~TRINITY_DN17664_c0_g1_i2.p1  ORF type:complete len:593 (+),score=94.71 TRINITY_DN17664_c0_g1_i2:2-1780(+)